MFAPIVLFVYNRPKHTTQTLQALIDNPLATKSDLLIYSDAPKSTESANQVREVRSVIHSLNIKNKAKNYFKSITIIERDYNFGLADSIIDGVTSIMNQYGKAIVLEDDIVVSPVFLDYMNDALTRYENNKKVWSIAAWSYPISNSIGGGDESYFFRQFCCWGWGSWADRWKHFKRDIKWVLDNFDKNDIFRINLDGYSNAWGDFLLNKKGKIKSWAIFYYLIGYKHKALNLCPNLSYIKQIGFDGSGVHCGSEDFYNANSINTKFPISYPNEVVESKLALQEIQAFIKSLQKPFIKRAQNKAKKIIKQILKWGGADKTLYHNPYKPYTKTLVNPLNRTSVNRICAPTINYFSPSEAA